MFGLTGSQVAILVGVVSGATICIFIILCGAIVVHRRKKKAAKLVQQFEDRYVLSVCFLFRPFYISHRNIQNAIQQMNGL